LSLPVTVGIVVGAIFAALVILTTVVWLWRCRQQSRQALQHMVTKGAVDSTSINIGMSGQ